MKRPTPQVLLSLLSVLALGLAWGCGDPGAGTPKIICTPLQL